MTNQLGRHVGEPRGDDDGRQVRPASQLARTVAEDLAMLRRHRVDPEVAYDVYFRSYTAATLHMGRQIAVSELGLSDDEWIEEVVSKVDS